MLCLVISPRHTLLCHKKKSVASLQHPNFDHLHLCVFFVTVWHFSNTMLDPELLQASYPTLSTQDLSGLSGVL